MSQEINLTPTASVTEIGPEGRKIFCRTWGTVSECRAAVLLVHGLGAHSGWFEAFARRLKVRRIYTMAFDLVGFGKLAEHRFKDHEQWIGQMRTVANHLRQEIGDMPLYLVGNSLGSVITVAGVNDVRPDGLAILCPGFEGHPGAFTVPYKVKSILQALLKPDSELELPYTEETISRDETVRHWIHNDPDRRNRVPARMALELIKLSNLAQKEGRSIDCPTLMVTAGADRIVDNRANDRFFQRLSCPRKVRKHFPEAWHDLPFDPQVDEVADAVVQWISECKPEQLLAN